MIKDRGVISRPGLTWGLWTDPQSWRILWTQPVRRDASLGFQRSLFTVCLNKHTELLKPIESWLNMIVVNTKTAGKSSVIALCGMVWWVGTWQMLTDVYCNGTMIYGGTCEVEKALAYFLSTGGFTPMILDGSCFFSWISEWRLHQNDPSIPFDPWMVGVLSALPHYIPFFP